MPPFYEYECENCKFYTELLQKVSDAPLKKCPSCGKSTMKKLVSAPVFRLKGGGWYETDFKGDSENKRNLAVDKEPDTSSESKPTKAAAATDTKAEGKSDAKPDAKPAAESKPSESASKSESSSSGSGGRKSSSSLRASSSATKSKGRAPAGRVAVKSKAKPAAKRKGR